MAGGYGQFADDLQVFVILPDGTARRVRRFSWFDISGDEVPPGSAIFVSRDLSGIDTHQMIIDLTQIGSQLATTAAAMAVLSKY